MKIKDINQYRTYYKNEIRQLPDRDENLMGSFTGDIETGKKTFGWFDIYHGDKEGYGTAEEGIANFLQSFLDMAKDGQAVYEFLQNAVDAGSSHFTMIWGKDEINNQNYVLIANNGKMFDFNNVRSILNVGSSTKTNNSEHIGKFGIGFKLAHRLVGKENGLEELLDNNPSGPILFSWKNYEIEDIANSTDVIPSDIEFKSLGNNQYNILDDNPWLFKILITCFPVLPNTNNEENTILVSGKKPSSPTFKTEEYNTFCRWVKKHKSIFNKETYEEGSMFFIKLGQGKENDLADSNLENGVRFSLAVLQETSEKKNNSITLETVQLNEGKPITKPELNYHNFLIEKNKQIEDYLYIRFGKKDKSELSVSEQQRFDKEDNIEVLFGFRDYTRIDNYFKGAPNFYLFFPLSEEVHNFNFILHSNAFYKASSRTFLHKGTFGSDGINERLLRTIAKRLLHELQVLASIDKNKFLNLYAALLTSEESKVHDRQWIKEPFIDTITKSLKTTLPYRSDFSSTDFKISKSINSMYFKSTQVELNPKTFGVEVKWFYWDETANYQIKPNAIKKLGLQEFDLIQLLSVKDRYQIVNDWIVKDNSRINQIFSEFNRLIEKSRITDPFKENLSLLKIFHFENDELLNMHEVIERQNDGYLIINNKLFDIKSELRKLGLVLSKVNVNFYQYFQFYTNYFPSDSQLRGHSIVIDIFNSKIDNESLGALTIEEKWNIFNAFRDTIDDKKTERLGELKLFRNVKGNVEKLKHILHKTEISWLRPFVINPEEYQNGLDVYLVNKDKSIYTNIIFYYWTSISQVISQSIAESIPPIMNQIDEFYKKSSNDNKSKLNEHSILFMNGQATKANNPFYKKELGSISPDIYEVLQNFLNNSLNIQIPDRSFLKFYQSCFSIGFRNKENLFAFENLTLNSEKIIPFLSFVEKCELNLFQSACISKKENNKYEICRNSNLTNYYSENKLLIKLIDTNFSQSLILLPPELSEIKNLIPNRNQKLLDLIFSNIDKYEPIDVVEALIEESKQDQLNLLKHLESIELSTTWDTSDSIYTLFINNLLTADANNTSLLQQKISIKYDDDSFDLYLIEDGNDSIEYQLNEQRIPLSRANLSLNDHTEQLASLHTVCSNAIEKGGMDRTLAHRLFKLESKEAILENLVEYKSYITENKIKNTDQLWLVIILSLQDKLTANDYFVQNNHDKWVRLNGSFIIPPNDSNEFYDANYCLDKYYSSFLLKFDNTHIHYSKDSSKLSKNYDLISDSFIYKSNCHTNVLIDTENHEPMLSHLYSIWKSRQFIVGAHKTLYNVKNKIGFNPNQCFLEGIFSPSEKLPSYIDEWLQSEMDNKLNFLKFIGVNHNHGFNKIYKLRKSLLTDDNLALNIDLTRINKALLKNTLFGIAENSFIDNHIDNSFNLYGITHKIINSIIQELLNHSEEVNFPIPVYIDNHSFTLSLENIESLTALDFDDFQKMKLHNDSDPFSELNKYTKIVVPFNEHNLESYFNIKRLEINYSIKKDVNLIEHTEPFYKAWKAKHNISLYRCPKILHQASASINNLIFELGIVSIDKIYYDEVNSEIYYDEKLGLEQLHEYFNSNDDLSSKIKTLINSRNEVLAKFYSAINQSEDSDISSELSNVLKDFIVAESIEDERKQIIENINDSLRFSHQWFEHFIKYLQSFEEISETTTQKNISFQKISHFFINEKISDKYFLLEGANNVIPVNIESFQDFSVKLTFKNSKTETIKVEGVSKKGQNLLMYIPGGLSTKVTANFKNLVIAKIEFTPVLDLVKRLYDSFINPEIISHWNDILLELPSLHFLYGPPGTGKTTSICNILNKEIEIKPTVKALILVPTNKGGDVIAKKLISQNSKLWTVRLGAPSDPELEELDIDLYHSSLSNDTFKSCNLVISTIHRLPYYKIESDYGPGFNLFSSDAKWDYIIFDESSMISLPYMVFGLMSLKKTNPQAKFIVAGDPKQIPPVIDSTDKELEKLIMSDDNIYKMLSIDSFDPSKQTLREQDTIENLQTQYRSVNQIGALFSDFSYESLLSHGRDINKWPVKELPESFIQQFKEPILFIDYPIANDNSVLQPKKLLYSSYQVYVGLLVAELVKHLSDSNMDKSNYSIGIISPYKAQAILMNKLITSFNLPENLDIQCDTVHGFQGDERDIIIFIVNPNNTYYTGHKNSLLSKHYLYNVAISRAKDFLWIFHPLSDIRNNPFINEIKNAATNQNNYNYIKSKEIEQFLFDSPSFLYDNSFITGHDNINVFGQVDMKYFIKAGETAIDIQLKK